jgi:hypothetical protein
VSSERDSLRAADVDREFVAEKLRAALNEGRLTLTEYDDRVRDAYAARTYGDLKGLLTDLPDVAPAERSQVVPAAPAPTPAATRPGHTRQWIAGMWSSWLSVSAIMIVIWIASGNHDSFWPVWVIGPWGAILLASTISGLIAGEPHKQAAQRRVKDADKAQRKADEAPQKATEKDERDLF